MKMEVKMNEGEVMQFYEKYISGMSVGFTKTGNAELQNKPALKK